MRAGRDPVHKYRGGTIEREGERKEGESESETDRDRERERAERGALSAAQGESPRSTSVREQLRVMGLSCLHGRQPPGVRSLS